MSSEDTLDSPGMEQKVEEAPRLEKLFKFGYGHRVRYDEVDAQAVVGNATWLNLLQLGRIEYLRSLGMILEGGQRTPVQMVVRRSQLDYLKPARFDDPVIIRVRCAYLGHTSARFEYLVDDVEGLRCLVGETLVVCVEMASFKSTPWPQFWRERVAEFEGENLQIGQR